MNNHAGRDISVNADTVTNIQTLNAQHAQYHQHNVNNHNVNNHMHNVNHHVHHHTHIHIHTNSQSSQPFQTCQSTQTAEIESKPQRTFQAGNHSARVKNNRNESNVQTRAETRENALSIVHKQHLQSQLVYDTNISDNFDDKLQFNNIVSRVLNSIQIPIEIAKNIGEYGLGVFHKCKACGNDVSVLHKPNTEILYYNPRTKLLKEGYIDVNDKIQIICNKCLLNGNVKQCEYKICKSSKVINVSDISFSVLFCSERFMDRNGINVCSSCMNGRAVKTQCKTIKIHVNGSGFSYSIRDNNDVSIYRHGNGNDKNNYANSVACHLM